MATSSDNLESIFRRSENSWDVLQEVLGGLKRLLGHLGELLEQLGRFLACLATILGRHASLEAVLNALRPGAR